MLATFDISDLSLTQATVETMITTFCLNLTVVNLGDQHAAVLESYFEVFHFLESTHAVGPKDSVVYRTFEIGRTRQHHLHRHVLMSANALLRCVKELASAKESEGNRCGTCEGAGWEEP